ncbi:MAG: tRNA (N(6)-L-threonylcarbamoyladenosine(37)-C(2))-methylthiotransferase MtaB [Bacteroidales bacterium]|nr:tRNA (N(6)-L-threonylcarbamoyladenosine(37)-C(2))-methylthiotransferase MtaB [Bacteroidales bacterium]
MKSISKKRIAFKTLGCRLNQYETNAVVTDFVNAGYEIVDFNQQADAYVVNTCTVTNMSDHKSRQTVSQASRKNEEAVLVVTGCMANNHKEKLEANDKITYTIENEKKGSIFHLLDSHFKGEMISPGQLEKDRFNFGPAEHSLLTRSLVKIQDGCNNFCTFCIVPHVRGRAESRSWESIEKNIRAVVSHGYKEIVLTGVNIGRYEYEGMNFEDMVEKILEIPGDFRVRISSIEPEGFGNKLFGLFKHPKLMPHLHMCLQSGSDKILLKMRRQYTIDEFKGMVNKVRSIIPEFNFTTDIIVGFPGETEEDFNESCKVAEEIGFSHIHTFKYSVRNGTRAERMPDQVPEKIKKKRSAVIHNISEKHKRLYRSSFIGKKQNVLVEKIDKNGFATGYGENYMPVKFRADELTSHNNFREVIITGINNSENYILLAEINNLS